MSTRSRSRAGALPGVRRGVLVALALLGLTLPGQAQAQDAAEDEVRAVIQRLFDGMRLGDSTMVRSTFHPTARLLTSGIQSGQPRLQEGSVDDFVRAVGAPHDAMWDEGIENLEVRVDDPLATAWMDYRFHLGEQFSHCGVNAMQLVRTPDGWKILHVVDTRRPACPA